ncbi:OV-16 antigen [Pseudolycoriella hygida]|uniref:OV-16 antigen n=1 Tax=Pseudolycoriella hygida TaxID=35572 RepID=A0A9Q0RX27_9DIPT|nr:OV-16 antigen [Pseudolycoriella hygida]
MEDHQIVPDVISTAPVEIAKITFRGGVNVNLGNELKPIQLKDIPEVFWDADAGSFYALCLIDPDAPSKTEPIYRSWQHWLIVNIPGMDVQSGETLSEYIGSSPGQGTGLHRYVFLIYKQNGKLHFDEKYSNNRCSREDRRSFQITKFAEKYRLGTPVAGNFYLAQWGD